MTFSVLGLGVGEAFSAFSGFEGRHGEETRRSTHTIPAAVAWSLVGSAAVYIVFTWIAGNAYPSPAALPPIRPPSCTWPPSTWGRPWGTWSMRPG